MYNSRPSPLSHSRPTIRVSLSSPFLYYRDAAAATMSDDDKKLEEVAARETIVNALKRKIQSLAKKRTDVLESLASNVRKRVEALKEIQDEHDDLEKKFFEERAALEDKYQKLYEPLYTMRYEIVNGDVEAKGVTNETAEKDPDEDKGSGEKGVPNFWLTAMKANDVLEEEIQEHDEEALKFLKDIKWSRVDNTKGFKLEFFFNPNPYFKNPVLTKTYIMIDEDESILEKAIGTEIEWFPEKCLTQKLQKKKPKKGSKNVKPVTRMQNCESFFNFFSPPQVPDDDASEDIDEDAAEELENQMEADFDIGSTIRDQIIPHAVSWYTGEAIQEDDFEIVGNIEDADGDENEEDEEDEEDHDDDDEREDANDEEESANVQKEKSGLASAGDGQRGLKASE